MVAQDEIKLLFQNKKYFEVLHDFSDDASIEDFKGFLYLESKQYEKAEQFFKERKKYFQQGFTRLLQGDKIGARSIFYMNLENPAIIWGKVVLGIIDQKLEAIPTFLQIRNFLEMTLHYFFQSNQIDFAIKLISAKEFLSDCNIETFKYIGRVLMDNEEDELALEYLNKAIDVIPQDYEAYFYMGEMFLRQQEKGKAVKAYTRVLELNPYHTPAEKILEKIKN